MCRWRQRICGFSLSLVGHITCHAFDRPRQSRFRVRWGSNVLNLEYKVFERDSSQTSALLSTSCQSLCFVFKKMSLKLQNEEMKKTFETKTEWLKGRKSGRRDKGVGVGVTGVHVRSARLQCWLQASTYSGRPSLSVWCGICLSQSAAGKLPINSQPEVFWVIDTINLHNIHTYKTPLTLNSPPCISK